MKVVMVERESVYVSASWTRVAHNVLLLSPQFKSTNDTKDGQEMSSSSTRTTKKKQDDVRKADEAEEWYKQCVIEANVRQRELLKTKSHVLVELRQLIYQCDQTMKAVSNFTIL